MSSKLRLAAFAAILLYPAHAFAQSPVDPATGGTVTTSNAGAGSPTFALRTFTSNGNLVVTQPIGNMDYLMVGGGGAGGRGMLTTGGDGGGGGGGGGAVLNSSLIGLGAATYPVVVGGGGFRGGSTNPGVAGGATTFNGFIAGGGGAGGESTPAANPQNGGSGANGSSGGGGGANVSTIGTGGTGSAPGTNGGAGVIGGTNPTTGGGGGGGAGGAGSIGPGGAGGPGVNITFHGVTNTYSPGGAGALGGAGIGTDATLIGGGGGGSGGARNTSIRTGGSGANGIVMLYYAMMPGVAISGAPVGILSTTPFNVTVTFSEDVTGFTSPGSDLTVTNGSATAITPISATTYQVTITPSGTGNVSITVPLGAAVGSASNQNAPSGTTTVPLIRTTASGTSITASPTSVVADGTTTSTITVQLRDGSGNPVSMSGVAIVLSTTHGTLAAPSGNTNASGQYTTTITSPTTGIGTVSMTVGGTAAANTASVTFTAGAISLGPTGTSITASPTSVAADGVATSTITLQLRDVNGNPVLQSGVAIVLSSTHGTLAAPSGSTNASGQYTTTITSPTTGVGTISATVSATPAANSANVTFTAGAVDIGATGTSITASPTSVTANGVATSTITVQLRDVNGNAVMQAGVAIVLSTTHGTLAAASGSTNASGQYTTTITSATIGTGTISMTVNSSPAANTATVNFVAGAIDTTASGTSITASPTSVAADGVATSTITVQLRDVNGNAVMQAGVPIVLSTTIGTLAAPSGSTDANGQYTTTITSLASGNATVSMTVNGSPAANSATVTFTPGAISVGATGTSITASPTSVTANGVATSTITVQLRDVNGNAVMQAGVPIVLSTTHGTLAAASGSTNASGQYTTTITSATIGTGTISMTVNSSPAANTATVNFIAGSVDTTASGTSITASPTSVAADGVATSTITVQLRDMNGNAVMQAGVPVVLSTTIGTLAAPSGATNASGQYTTTITSLASGNATVSMTVNGSPAANSATVTFTAGAISVGATGTSITASPTSVTANGVATSTITVQLRDVNGNPVLQAGEAIVLSTTHGTLAAASGFTNASGQYTTTITSATIGTGTISMDVNSSPATNTATVTFTAGSVDTTASGTSITASPASVTADGSSPSTITVQLRDMNGNPVMQAGVPIVLSTTIGTLAAPSGSTNASGQYTTTITSLVSGNATVSMTVNGAPAANTATVSFGAGAVDDGPTGTSIAASPTSVTANGAATSTITVQLRDVNGNPVPQSGISIVLSSTIGTIAVPSGVTDANGEYTTTITSTAAGTATISMDVNGSPAANTATVTFTAGSINVGATGTSITSSPATATADGASPSTIVVQLRDVNGNPIMQSGIAVVLSSTLGTLAAPSGTTDANGQYTTTITSTGSGNATISMNVNGFVTANTTAVNFTSGSFDPGAGGTSIQATPNTVVANGSATSTIVVQLRDAFGNPVLQSGVAIVLSSSIGTLAAPSGTTDANGQYTTTITSTDTGAATISMTVDGTPADATANIMFQDAVGASVVLTNAPASFAGVEAFTVTAKFSKTVNNFDDPATDVIVKNGTVTAITGGPAVYTLAITPTGKGDVSIKIPAGIATDLTSNPNLASNTLVVKNTVVEDTQRAIARFMVSRANNLASRQPVITGFLMGDPCGAFNVNINGPNATGKFCANYGGAWTDFSGSWTLDGSYYLGSLGAHFHLSRDLIVGGMLQYDNAVNDENKASGTGWMYGPYFVARLPNQPLYFDGRFLYGQTDNQVSPYGTYTDSFQTDRWLATIRTTGQVDFGVVSLMPSIEYRHLEDTQQLYTDSLGNIIPSQTTVLKQLEAGVNFSLPIPISKGMFEVTGGVSTIYSMTDGAENDFEGARAKFELGANYTTEAGSRLNLQGFYDGVGTDFESYGGKMDFLAPF